MKENLIKISGLDEKDYSLMQNALNLLITGNFLIRGLEEHRKYYKFVISNRGMIEAYLDCAGWTLVIDETLGVLSWRGPASVRLNITLDETLALLVFRLMFEEKRHEISLHEHPAVYQQDFQEKFRTTCDRKLNKTRLREILRRFQGLKLIRIHGDEIDPETRIELLPSIVFALNGIAIEEIYERIKHLEGSNIDIENNFEGNTDDGEFIEDNEDF